MSGIPGLSTGSPTPRRAPASLNVPKEENIKFGKEDSSTANETDGPVSQKKPVSALSTSSLVNQSCPKMKLSHESSGTPSSPDPNPMDHLLEKLSHQQSVLHKQGDSLKTAEAKNAYPSTLEHASTSISVPITPATEIFGTTAPTTRPASAAMGGGSMNTEEVLRLKLELAQARNKINRLDHELFQTRQVQPTPEPVVDSSMASSPVEVEFPPGLPAASNPSRILGPADLKVGSQQSIGRDGGHPWTTFDDSRSDTSDALSATGFNRTRNIWGPSKNGQGSFQGGFSGTSQAHNNQWVGRGANQGFVDQTLAYEPSVSGSYHGDRLTPDYDMTVRPSGNRRNNRYDSRLAMTSFPSTSGFGDGYNYNNGRFASDNAMVGPAINPSGSFFSSTPLSPLASEFTSASSGAPWKSESATSEGQTYLPTTEPLNYRRLLDRNVNCNWKYIVDKIVCNNDQQASIFLQQKLKVGTPDQKYEIVEAIVAQAYPLMVNRFGNFLVQRCFEHGTPEQVIKIAEAIRGCTLNLSMDPFGCHVVQKAFDSVPEDYKAIMVHELLRRIPETVIHRYACHVWQKLFELRWTESPPQIMKYVNDALHGMWHEVALGETGSLVVQNIFENCLEEDKRPCIEEVLANIDIIAHGQFGNWCIQHICEHGAPADRSRAIDHVIRYAAEYSMDQYASKVVEKCLKIGSAEFLSRYLDRVCEGRVDRPRIPLIDIASDQYGNYLIQWILTHASPQHREIVAAHIRKHMVSLRGSKFGSRVGMLCTNPAVATRPGPGVGGGLGRMPAGPRYNSRAYQ
ncbi:ARM repeat-containing protein [Hypoxylon trugodes]|uniref:ARM repeat-containing protein n=1 Tax=Hypoxylon trugodes TaxID=326681 RepID=UPI002191C1A0|nr:ARM repeat-containing protein [Hypoxylon trugodes]KAI1388395.1 ARM repeat-containing protein [Hypoxylon trugodes]